MNLHYLQGGRKRKLARQEQEQEQVPNPGTEDAQEEDGTSLLASLLSSRKQKGAEPFPREGRGLKIERNVKISRGCGEHCSD